MESAKKSTPAAAARRGPAGAEDGAESDAPQVPQATLDQLREEAERLELENSILRARAENRVLRKREDARNGAHAGSAVTVTVAGERREF